MFHLNYFFNKKSENKLYKKMKKLLKKYVF